MKTISMCVLALFAVVPLCFGAEEPPKGLPVFDGRGILVGTHVDIHGYQFEKNGYFFSLPSTYQQKNHVVYTTFQYFDEKCMKTPYITSEFPVENFVYKVTPDQVFVTTGEVREIKDGDTIYREMFDVEGMQMKRKCVADQKHGDWVQYAQKLRAIDRKTFTKESGIDFSVRLTPPFRIGKP